MALGMVTLGQGGNVSSGPSGHLYQGLSDLHLEDRLHQFMVGGSNMNATTVGSSEEHWIMNDNRYALDQNGVHHGKCGTFDVVSVLFCLCSVLCTCIVLYCSVLCTLVCIVLYCSVLFCIVHLFSIPVQILELGMMEVYYWVSIDLVVISTIMFSQMAQIHMD